MNANSTLARLRGELDRIDNDLLELVEQRFFLCSSIRDAKEKEAWLHLRPRRQEQIVRRLQGRAVVAPRDAVRDIWREIIAHSLNAQARTCFLIVDEGNPDRLLRLVREEFGSAGQIEWTRSVDAALERAAKEELVAIVPHGSNLPLPPGLSAFQLLCDEDGHKIAWAVGRICGEDPDRIANPSPHPWHPASWRDKPALQLPHYEDRSKLGEVEQRLARRAPIVELHDVDELMGDIAEVADGRATILQGGDCAETFADLSRGRIGAVADLLSEMGAIIARGSSRKTVLVGRIAGQLAKPRSELSETVNGVEVPTYRGDAINGAEPHLRDPDAMRLLQAHEHSEKAARWLARMFPASSQPVYVSHEALLLNYEQALTRQDARTGRWWSGSAHALWIGDRTRQVDGAHVEYARGIANPIAVKLGPSIGPEELVKLLETLDPQRTLGRLTLIPRLGARLIGSRLAALMAAVTKEGWKLPWLVDPMHGNTEMAGSIKTRRISNIKAEISTFFAICLSENVWPGGIHLELTPEDVTECVDQDVTQARLPLRYRTACDPRLNRNQALEIARLIAEQYRLLLNREAAR